MSRGAPVAMETEGDLVASVWDEERIQREADEASALLQDAEFRRAFDALWEEWRWRYVAGCRVLDGSRENLRACFREARRRWGRP